MRLLLLLWTSIFLLESSSAFTTTTTPKGWRSPSRCLSSPKSLSSDVLPDNADDEQQQRSSTIATASSVKKVKKKVAKRRKPGVAVRKKTAWEHAWVPTGERRDKVKSLIKEMERAHLRSVPKDTKEWDDVKVFLEEGMDILVQWAQLGEGDRCDAFATEMLDHCASWMNNWLDYYDLQVKIRRRVLHAYYNQLQRITWNGNSQKPKFQLSTKEATLGREVLEKADETLQQMERQSRDYFKKARDQNKNMRPLMDANDYAPLIMGYNQVGNKAVPALHALRRLTDLFERSDHLERLAPTTSLYIAVSKAIFNYKDEQDWLDRMGKSRTEMVGLLCIECVEYSRQFPKLLKTNINLYNVALDGWSKALPPPTRERGTASASKLFVNDEQLDKMNLVATSVSDLWKMLQEDGLTPNAKTFTSIIYTYTKTGNLDEAYALSEKLMEMLLAAPEKKEKVDSRAMRMLATALARSMNALDEESARVTYAERVEKIIDALWELDSAGYSDVAPDVFLYTTAVDAWATAQCNQSALRAQMLLDDLKSRYESLEKRDNLKPDIAVYNAVVKAVATQPGLVDAAAKAGAIVKALEDEDIIRPNVSTYNALVQACLASPTDIIKAEQTLDHMSRTGKPPPNERTFSSIIYALLAVPGGTARAEAILDRMEERFQPRASLYERVISSWCEEAGMAMQARQLLERMEELFATNQDNESLRPNRSLYNSVIQALEDQDETAAAEALKIKRDEMYGNAVINRKLRSNNQVFAMLKEVDANLSGIGGAPSGNTYNFNHVLSQLADSGKVWAGLRADDVLNYMLELTFKRKNRDATPNIITFNTVIAAWAKSHHALAGEKASEVMKKLEDLHDMGLLEDVIADRVTYNTLMNAYAKSRDIPDAGEKAQECFDKLHRQYEVTGDEQFRPDLVSYSTLLSAWARSKEAGAAKRAEDILLKMHADHTADDSNPEPDTICFNEVLYAWARSRDAKSSERAQSVLHLMEDMKQYGNSNIVPDTRTYNIVLLALANSPDQDSPVRAMKLLDEMQNVTGSKPDAVSYNTAISAFTKKGSVNAALQMLEELFVRKDVVLDSKFFSSLIYSLSQTEASDAPIVAERILSDLLERQHIEITTDICNALINCWGRSSSSDPYRRALRAEEILTEMLEGKFPAPPDVVTFTSVIDSWAKSGDPEAADRAEAVLSKMIGIAEPNVKTYTATIQAYARSHDRDKAKRAQELLKRMKQDYANGNRDAEPTTFVYNAVLNAAEFTVGNEAELEVAFQVACETFDEVRSSEGLTPDHVTYGSFMGVISQLMPKSDIRNDMVQLVFRRCCKDGQLAPVVMKKFEAAADSDQFLTLMGKGNITEGKALIGKGNTTECNLPKEWTCNVRGARQ